MFSCKNVVARAMIWTYSHICIGKKGTCRNTLEIKHALYNTQICLLNNVFKS